MISRLIIGTVLALCALQPAQAAPRERGPDERRAFLDLLDRVVPRRGTFVATTKVDATPYQVVAIDFGSGAWFVQDETSMIGRSSDGVPFRRDERDLTLGPRPTVDELDLQNLTDYAPVLHLARLRAHPDRITSVERDGAGDFLVEAVHPYGRFAETQTQYDALDGADRRGPYGLRLVVNAETGRITSIAISVGEDPEHRITWESTPEYSEQSPGFVALRMPDAVAIEAYPEGRPALFSRAELERRAVSIPLGRAAPRRIQVDRAGPEGVDPTGRFTILGDKPSFAERFRTPLVIAGIVVIAIGVLAAIRRGKAA